MLELTILELALEELITDDATEVTEDLDEDEVARLDEAGLLDELAIEVGVLDACDVAKLLEVVVDIELED